MDLMVTSDDGAVHAATVLPSAAKDAPILLCLPAMGAAAGYYAPFAQALAAARPSRPGAPLPRARRGARRARPSRTNPRISTAASTRASMLPRARCDVCR
jgi:hypothetical protein